MCGGNELNIDVDEPWVWAKHRKPIIIQINPSLTAGTVSVSYGSNIATLSNAPVDPISQASISVQNYMLKSQNSPECYIVANHTAGSTILQLDSLYSQTTASTSYTLFQLDYELTPSYISIDNDNNILDFTSNATAGIKNAVILNGSYTPTALCGAITTGLNAADPANSYSASYDPIQRLFYVNSNLTAASAIFTINGAGPNYYRSAWDTLGFDFTTSSGSGGANGYTAVYPLGSIVRFSQPGRIYYGSSFWSGGGGDGRVGLMDPVAFDTNYPLIGIQQGTPDTFCLLSENRTGRIKIRLNKYLPTTQAMRLEFDYIQEARDLFNNTASIPLIPKSYRKILEYGAAYYLSLDKQDTRADTYLGVAQQALKAMQKANRRELDRAGKNFGNVIARWDLMPNQRHRRANLYGYDLLSGGY